MRDEEWLTPVDEPAGRPRRPWLRVAIVAPWVVVGAVALFARGPTEPPDAPVRAEASDPDAGGSPRAPEADAEAAGPDTEVADAEAERDAEVAGPDAEVADAEVADAEAEPSGAELASVEPERADAEMAGPHGSETDAEVAGAAAAVQAADTDVGRRAAAVATVVARGFVTAVEPRLVIDGVRPEPGGLYAEHLVVEAVRVADDGDGDGPALVTLLAVVLDAEDDLRPTVRRLAVPLVVEAGLPRPGGRPWWVPGPDLSAARVVGSEDEDPDLLADAAVALQAAGLAEVTIDAVVRTDSWPVLVTGSDEHGHEVEVWLEADGERWVVAGSGDGGRP